MNRNRWKRKIIKKILGHPPGGTTVCLVRKRDIWAKANYVFSFYFGKVMLLNLFFKLVIENMNCRNLSNSDNLTSP